MYRTGHYGAALLVYAPVGFALSAVDPALAVLCGVGAVALSRLPDYDLMVPFVDHRGITHTVVFLLVVASLLAGAGWAFADAFGTPPVPTAAVGAIAGTVAVGSHLLADALTPAGVPLLWPLSKKRYTLSVARASNPIANYGLLAAGVGLTVALAFLAGGQ